MQAALYRGSDPQHLDANKAMSAKRNERGARVPIVRLHCARAARDPTYRHFIEAFRLVLAFPRDLN